MKTLLPPMILAACTIAGCVDRAPDVELFGSEPAPEDLAVDSDPEALGYSVELASPTTSGPGRTLAATALPGDRDGDHIPDEIDTCPDTADSSNVDTDLDGVGNACDADYDNDGAVAGSDYAVLLAAFGRSQGGPGYDARADHDLDGTVAGSDFATFLRYFGTAPAGSAGTIALDRATVGDELVVVGRFSVNAALGLMTLRGAITTVERDAGGHVTTIAAGSLRLDRWSTEAWVFEGLPYATGNSFGVCPRSVAFPARPFGPLSQTCSPTNFSSFALAVHR